MKVLDFINTIRPITALNPEAEFEVSTKGELLFFDYFDKDIDVHLHLSIKCLEVDNDYYKEHPFAKLEDDQIQRDINLMRGLSD